MTRIPPELAAEAQQITAAAHARRALFDRILLAIGDWDDVALAYLAGELEAGHIGPPPAPIMAATCNGEGTCHGDATHCQLCGEVTDVCDLMHCPYHDTEEATSDEEEDGDVDRE